MTTGKVGIIDQAVLSKGQTSIFQVRINPYCILIAFLAHQSELVIT